MDLLVRYQFEKSQRVPVNYESEGCFEERLQSRALRFLLALYSVDRRIER